MIKQSIDKFVADESYRPLNEHRRDFIIEFIGNHMTEADLDNLTRLIESADEQRGTGTRTYIDAAIGFLLVEAITAHCEEHYPEEEAA